MSVLEDLASLLDGILGLTIATNLFISFEPESPDLVVILYEYPGMAPEQLMSADMPAADLPRVQSSCRAGEADYATGRTLAQEVFNVFSAVRSQTINGTRYLNIAPISNPALASRDRLQRPIFTTNFQITKDYS